MPSFLAPLFLLGALAAAVPVVLHLLKRHPETRVRFAAVHLLRNAPVEMTSRRRLRELILLALRATALILLALAFARPFLAEHTSAQADGVTVVALDASLSLSASGQFERARRLAREAIDAAPAAHLVGVMTFSGTTEVLAAPSADRGLAASAIDRAAAGPGTTRYRAALSSALAMIQEHASSGRIVVVSDLNANGWRTGDEMAVPESVTVEVMDVGEPPPNLAVTSARVDRGAVRATIRNTGDTARTVSVRLTVDAREAAQSTARLEADSEVEVAFPAVQGDEAVVSISDEEGVAADNARYVLIGRREAGAVAVLTSRGDLPREALYVEQALVAGRGRASGQAVAGVALTELTQLRLEQLNRYRAVIVLSTRGLDRRGRDLLQEFITSGGGILLAIGPDVDAEIAGELVGGTVTLASQSGSTSRVPLPGERRLVPADARHPVFRAFSGSSATLAAGTFERIATLRAEGCTTLARFTTGEDALLDCERGRGRLLVFASDLGRTWNDLPRQASFVAFLNEAVAYLSNDGREGTSEFLIDDRPAGVPAEPGFATRPSPVGETGQRVAINVDPEETSGSRLTPEAFRAALVAADAPAGDQPAWEATPEEARQQLWWYLVLAMLVVLAAEGWVGARVA